MKYKLIIDRDAEEEIIAVVRAPSSLTEQIENLVRSFSGPDSIMGYRDDEMRKLAFRSASRCQSTPEMSVAATIGGGPGSGSEPSHAATITPVARANAKIAARAKVLRRFTASPPDAPRAPAAAPVTHTGCSPGAA